MRVVSVLPLGVWSVLIVMVLGLVLSVASKAQLVVDCTGPTPAAFTSINAAH